MLAGAETAAGAPGDVEGGEAAVGVGGVTAISGGGDFSCPVTTEVRSSLLRASVTRRRQRGQSWASVRIGTMSLGAMAQSGIE